MASCRKLARTLQTGIASKFHQLQFSQAFASSSPYSILGLSANATRPMIKARFRSLAKEYHPDRNESAHASQKMAEIIEAYDALVGGDLAGRMSSGSLVWSIEALSVEELREDGRYDVYALRLALEEALLEPLPGTNQAVDSFSIDHGCNSGEVRETESDLQPVEAIVPVVASLDDSVLDLKRQLQADHGQEWGISDRPIGRDKVSSGWELVFDGSALGYHLFLHDYGLFHGALLHAVVRCEG